MKRIFLVSAFVIFGLAGCINYIEDITLNADGSGKLIMHYSMSEQLTSMMEMGQSMGGDKKDETSEMPFKLKEDEVKADLQAKGVKVEKFETKKENQEQHFYVTVSFDKLTDLNQTKTFKEMPFEWSEEGDTVQFKHTLRGKKDAAAPSGTGQDDQMAKQMAQAMFGNAAFEFKVKLPSDALPSPDTNGTIAEDGSTVSWKYPLMDISEGGDKVMVTKFKKGGFPIMILAGLAVGAVLMIGAVIFIIAMARKK